METVADALDAVRPETPRASLQFVLVGAGTTLALGCLLAIGIGAAVTWSAEREVAGVLALTVGPPFLGGLVLLAAGLAIPQRPGDGLQCSHRQRALAAYGAVAPILGTLLLTAGGTLGPLVEGRLDVALVAVHALLFFGGPVATLLTIGSLLQARLPRAA